MFTAGLDLETAALGVQATSDAGPAADKGSEPARTALGIRREGKEWQQSFTNIEQCGKPVIACVHNACIGAGIEMIAACDIRFCTEDAYYVMAEVNIGMAADVGGLQRLPKLIGNQSLVRELALSGRKLGAEEALRHGLVSRIFTGKEEMMSAAVELAKQISGKSPVATLGIKQFLNYARDHSVEESLDYSITWNMAMLQGKDLVKAGASVLMKKTPEFTNLPSSKL